MSQIDLNLSHSVEVARVTMEEEILTNSIKMNRVSWSTRILWKHARAGKYMRPEVAILHFGAQIAILGNTEW